MRRGSAIHASEYKIIVLLLVQEDLGANFLAVQWGSPPPLKHTGTVELDGDLRHPGK